MEQLFEHRAKHFQMLFMQVALQVFFCPIVFLPRAAFERAEDAGPEVACICILRVGVWRQGRVLAEVLLGEVLVVEGVVGGGWRGEKVS